MTTPPAAAITSTDLLQAPILVVDDHPMNLRLLELTLRRVGYSRVFSTTDPFAVGDLCRELQPALILLDLRMPGRSGFAVLDELREAARGQALPVLVLTSDDTPETRQQALIRGARAVLTKPFDRLDLLHYVRTLLHVSLLEQQSSMPPARPARRRGPRHERPPGRTTAEG